MITIYVVLTSGSISFTTDEATLIPLIDDEVFDIDATLLFIVVMLSLLFIDFFNEDGAETIVDFLILGLVTGPIASI